MALPTQRKQWSLATRPKETPILSGPDATFRLETKDLPPLQENQVLLKALHYSNDPAQRTWVSGHIDPERHYAPPVPLGSPMRARALSEVLSSTAPSLPVGTHVLASTGWTTHDVVDASACVRADPLPASLPETHYLGALGLTGLTAYYGLVDIAQAKPADRVVISGAAGATGSIAIQLAKHVLGCRRVVGIAGSAAKCAWVVDALGADACVNYKEPDFAAQLARATEGFADVYFDNVGGAVLDVMLTRVAPFGRVAACGAISAYNAEGSEYGLRNWFQVIANRISIKGFIVLDAAERTADIVDTLKGALAAGKIRLDASSETVVPTAFEDVPQTWMRLFEGSNQGKLVTSLTD